MPSPAATKNKTGPMIHQDTIISSPPPARRLRSCRRCYLLGDCFSCGAALRAREKSTKKASWFLKVQHQMSRSFVGSYEAKSARESVGINLVNAGAEKFMEMHISALWERYWW